MCCLFLGVSMVGRVCIVISVFRIRGAFTVFVTSFGSVFVRLIGVVSFVIKVRF